VATKVFLGEYWTGATSDFRHVRNLLVQLASYGYFGPPLKEPISMFDGQFQNDEMTHYWYQLEDACERFIRANGAEVEAVAQALLEKESLTGIEVVKIIEQARTNRQNGYHEAEAILELTSADAPDSVPANDEAPEPSAVPELVEAEQRAESND
jgi:hypothetical protein